MKKSLIAVILQCLLSCSQDIVEGDPNHTTSQNDTILSDEQGIGEVNISQKPSYIDTTLLKFDTFVVELYGHDCSVTSSKNTDTIFLQEPNGAFFDRATFRILPNEPTDKFLVSAAFSKRIRVNANNNESVFLENYSLPIIYKILGAKNSLYSIPPYNHNTIETELNLDLERIKNIISSMNNIRLATPLIEISSINQLPVEPVIDKTIIKIKRTKTDGTFETVHFINESSFDC